MKGALDIEVLEAPNYSFPPPPSSSLLTQSIPQKMQVAASKLLGEHDFRNFCKMDVVNVQSFSRRVVSFEIAPFSASVRYRAIFCGDRVF